jgi:DNA-directed RNA polymerase sigma subunit (sigma70/sigma32)
LKEVAKELGISLQQARWAEESAMKKLRSSPELREALRYMIESGTFDGEHEAPFYE